MNAAAVTLAIWTRLRSHGGISAFIMSVVLGVTAGTYLDSILDSAYDWLRPVSKARVGEVQRINDEIRVRVYVTRLRGECRVTGVYAYAEMPSGPTMRAQAERLDKTQVGDIPTGQEIDIGWWRLWPVGGARKMVLYSYYDCAGRPTGARLFEVLV